MMRGGLLGTLITAAACATPSRPWMNASLPVKARVEMLLPHLSVRMHAPTHHPHCAAVHSTQGTLAP
jgi:hypothetical protein